jgi:glycosyltransferase involved in cell wall biosynthesis
MVDGCSPAISRNRQELVGSYNGCCEVVMRVALIAPPFIPVPPVEYGGTELFIADLACGLQYLGVDVTVYTNGESTVQAKTRWLFEKSQWPIKSDDDAQLKDIDHTTWSIRDASEACDILHLNSALGLSCSRLSQLPFVYTMHHPTNRHLSAAYARLPEVHYVCISKDQCKRENLPNLDVIHHGIDLSKYRLQTEKQQYLSFIGRIAPIKGTHLAIEIAKRAGIPLKIAGEVQPMYRDYFEAKVKPQIDGKFVEYIGRADLAAKNELLGNSLAMLFPIKWDEPFGLVMVEAMACGTPVLALRAGSVPEIVKDGISGYVSRNIDSLVRRIREMNIPPHSVRRYVEENFSQERMARDYCALYSRILDRKISPTLSRTAA